MFDVHLHINPEPMRSPMKNSPDYSESLLVHFRRVESLKEAALDYPSISLDKRQLCDLELLLNRAFYPLRGYMTRADYDSVLQDMRLADGTLWPIPVCLDVNRTLAESLTPGQPVALTDEEGFMLAILTVEETWEPDKKQEAAAIYGTDDPAQHPGVNQLLNQTGPVYVAGALEGIQLPVHYDFRELRLTPSDTHRLFSRNGWRNIIGFQSEADLHCAHREMTLRAAREAGASILLQPVVGLTHPGDLEHYTRVRCHQEIVKKYPKSMISMGLIPLAVRRAGPREALWHAIIRKNYGCSHFMVAEDHGDPLARGNGKERFYPPYAAQELVKAHEKETGIKMVPLKKMVYVEEKAEYLPEDEVKPDVNVKRISSSELRWRLEKGLDIPEWFSYPEVVAELRRAYPPRSRQGFTIFLTGFSGAGKSTRFFIRCSMLDVRCSMFVCFRHLRPHRALRGIETPQPRPDQPVRRVYRSLPFNAPGDLRAAGPQGALRQSEGKQNQGCHRY